MRLAPVAPLSPPVRLLHALAVVWMLFLTLLFLTPPAFEVAREAAIWDGGTWPTEGRTDCIAIRTVGYR